MGIRKTIGVSLAGTVLVFGLGISGAEAASSAKNTVSAEAKSSGTTGMRITNINGMRITTIDGMRLN